MGTAASTPNEQLLAAAERGDAPAIRAVLQGGWLAGKADVNVVDDQGRTPLDIACEKGHAEAVSALLAGGAHMPPHNKRDDPPLHRAAAKGHVGVIKALLAGGAAVNAHNYLVKTALITASEKGHVDAVKALLAGGAAVNQQCGHLSYTALHAASEHGHAGAVKALLAGGADMWFASIDSLRCTWHPGTVMRMRLRRCWLAGLTRMPPSPMTRRRFTWRPNTATWKW